MNDGRTANVQLHASALVVADTWRALREYGHHGCEGFVLWLGRLDAGIAHVDRALVPQQHSIRGEEGVGYFVTSQTLFELNLTLYRTGLRLLAQVHSHPTRAYHSSTDDLHAVVTAEGGFSIVVPDFAACEASSAVCAIYELRQRRWTELARGEVAARMKWEPVTETLLLRR